MTKDDLSASRRAVMAGMGATALVAAGKPPQGGATVLAEGLLIAEGPVALSDGSVLVCEVGGGRITRVHPDGRKSVASEPGGGPNGAAIGPDGALYLCNNGGYHYRLEGGQVISGARKADAFGRIEKIDIATGRVEILYDARKGAPFIAPNDIVFDASGGLWFSDTGAVTATGLEFGGICYAAPDGSMVKRVAGGLITPNGIALSPDGKTLYLNLSTERLVVAYEVAGPGELRNTDPRSGGRVMASMPGRNRLDSMKVEADGTICVASTYANPGIRRISPAGELLDLFPVEATGPTNIAFGGPDLRTAYITTHRTGRLLRARWPGPGLRLAFEA